MRAPAAAVVIAVAVAPGDHVEAGSRVAVLEAMKMEVVITAPVAGRVSEVLVAPNVQVEAGAPLLRLEPVADGGGRRRGRGRRPRRPRPRGARDGRGSRPPVRCRCRAGEADCLVVADTADALVPDRPRPAWTGWAPSWPATT